MILLGFLAAGVLASWPRASYLSGSLPFGGDQAQYVWSFWWVAHQVTHLGNPWFTRFMAAPVGVQLGYDTSMPLIGVLTAPVTIVFGPAASFNLVAIVTPGLAAYAMYRVARLWLASLVGAIAAGGFFGLSGMLTWQDWYHLNIAVGCIFLPLTLEAAIRLRRSPGVRTGVVLGLVLGASVLVNQETALMALVLAAIPVGLWLVAAPSATRSKVAAIAAATTAIIASPQLAAMAAQAMAGGSTVQPAVLARTYFRYAAELPSLFAPSTRIAHYGLTGLASVYTSHTPGESLATFGVVLSALALLGLAVSWRRRRRSACLLALLWLGAAVFALGPTLFVGGRAYVPLSQTWNGQSVSLLMPYSWLVRMPGLSALREADRIAFVGLVGASLLAGAAVEWLRRHARALLILVVALGALEAGWPGDPGQRTMPTTLEALDHALAADKSGSIVVDVPFGLRVGMSAYGMPVSPMALVVATSDGHPRAVSYTSWVPAPTTAAIKRHPFYVRLAAAQQGHRSNRAQITAGRADLRAMDVGWVLVWQSHPSSVLTGYLAATGFRFDYRAPGLSYTHLHDNCRPTRCGNFVFRPDGVSVYRLATSSGRSTSPS